jgi:hypothetical protein
MKITLTLIGQVFRCNGSMTINIFDQDRPIYSGADLPEGDWRVDCEINWPTTVNIITSGRSPNDMLTDHTGTVIQDKAIEVTQVLINNFPIQQDLTDKIFICRPEDLDVDSNQNWWSFNGKTRLEFDQPTPIRYLLSLRNEFNMNRTEWNTHE